MNKKPFFIQRSRRRNRGTFKLRLTSMIDMFTILLVFLLKSYSAEGQIVTITKDLRLPESTSQQPPQTTSVISVTLEWILLDGRPVVKIEDTMSNDSIIIPALQEELTRLKSITEGIGSLSLQMRGFRGNIAIQADQDITFDLIKRIMVTCGQVGYNDLLLTVLEKE
ncbi:hypothetical protein GF406_07890 [candidate division KSB1 bacterium]|nr:hypothetical protein [candidate division KSB1 bacterium]